MEKRCVKCGEVKQMSDFHKSSQWASGRHPYCKVCKSLADRLYREKKYKDEYRTIGKEVKEMDEVNVAQLLMNKLLEVEGILQDARDAIGHSFPAALSVEDDKWMSVELRALSHRVSDLIENIVEIERGKKNEERN